MKIRDSLRCITDHFDVESERTHNFSRNTSSFTQSSSRDEILLHLLKVLYFNYIMLRLIIVFLFLTTLVSSSSPPNNSSNSLLESESFLYSTLDDWILRINRTLSSPDLEQVSGQCHGHLTILLKSAKSRQPWALKSEYFRF